MKLIYRISKKELGIYNKNIKNYQIEYQSHQKEKVQQEQTNLHFYLKTSQIKKVLK